MASEILFQGKTRDEKEWIEGFYAVFSNTPFIGAPNHYGTMLWHPVIPETVRRFTGLTDKNGKRIFEGDVIQKDYDDGVRALFWLSWSDAYSSFMLKNNCGYENFPAMGFNLETEVIGNIHDNPELLNGKES